MPTKEEVSKFILSVDNSDYIKCHLERIVESYFFLNKYIPKDVSQRFIDLGTGEGPFARAVVNYHPNADYDAIDFDLRYQFPIKDETYDFVSCMEVFEHIKDREPKDMFELATHKGTGIYSMMCEINRTLKNGGLLFLTTPNMSTYMTIFRVLHYGNPNFYSPHPKEYGLGEINQILTSTGFEIIELESKNVWGNDGQSNPQYSDFVNKMDEFCIQNGFGTHLRNDNVFLIAKKNRAPNELLYHYHTFDIKLSELFPIKVGTNEDIK